MSKEGRCLLKWDDKRSTNPKREGRGRLTQEGETSRGPQEGKQVQQAWKSKREGQEEQTTAQGRTAQPMKGRKEQPHARRGGPPCVHTSAQV